MRLTLRTLLAYMDDILDPADQESLAKQVAESEKATELIHRTRDATRRLRLGAPPVIGEGMELDPNAAAEYLDSTMSADDMTEYQQVCLDSDVHLAEAASCHHILTMVLGEPAEIDPDMRQRMYGVPGRVDEWRRLRLDAAHRAATSSAAPLAAPIVATLRPSDSGVDEPITELPDYLKVGERSGLGRVLMACAAATLLGFGAYAMFGPDGMLTKQPVVAENTPVETPSVEPTAPADGTEVTPLPDLSGGTSLDEEISLGNNEAPATVESTPPATDPASAPASAATETPAANGSGLPTIHGLPETEPTTDATGVAPEATPPAEAMANNDSVADPSAVANPDKVAINTNVAEPTADPAVTPDEVPPATTDPVAATLAAQPPADAPIGTVWSTDQVLLEWDDKSGDWFRLPLRASILAGDQLISLPTFRPSLSVVSSLRVEFSGGASMKIDYAEDGKTPLLNVAYGRFLLHNTATEPVNVELMVGGESKRVTLAPSAVLGLDVDRPFVAGADVEQALGNFKATFYAPSGGVTWDSGGLPVVADKASQWTWANPALVSITDDVTWLDGESLDYLEQNVSRYFEKQLTTDTPARAQLLGLYESSRRREEKALAAQCGTHVGQFVPFVQSLADTQQQSNWDSHITELRRAMSRSTQAAKQVHQALTDQRGAELADDLFAMLRGYSPAEVGSIPEEVRAGVTRQLIDWLENDRLEYRVLAIHNLKQIYGGKTLGYNPVITEANRQERAVKQWRTRLADNELVPSAVAAK